MTTIILEQPGTLRLTDTPLNDTLGADEALLKVHRVGICGTDYHAFAGNQPFFSYPRILGHELGVEVVETGSAVTHVKTGDRCSVEPYFNFQEDQAVRRGFTNCGENISVLGVHQDGGMREYLKVPARYLHRSEQLSYDQLALIEPLSIGCHAVNRAGISAEDSVLVIGAGPIGMAVAQFATLTGAPTLMMDLQASRLDFATSALNLRGTVRADAGDVTEQIRSHFGGDLPTVVLDATGNRHSMRNALEYAAPAGRIVFVGLFQGDFAFPDPYFHQKELTLMASRNALPGDFRQIIRQMEEGKINAEVWITHRCAFDEMIDQFETWLRPETPVMKAVVAW